MSDASLSTIVAITGAAGKTGRALTAELLGRGVALRLLVRRETQAALLRERFDVGQATVVVGDVRDLATLAALLDGATALYHICPNMAPDEVEIGQLVVAAARAHSEEVGSPLHLVFHSVLHPQTPEMPHHWQKNLVEGLLWRSGLPATVLQPAAYMQNVLPGLARARDEGLHSVPYAAGSRVGMVDLAEVAEAAWRVLCEPGHAHATYELANGEALTQDEVAAALARALGRPVSAHYLPRAQWRAAAEEAGLPHYAIETLLRMFAYYEEFGFRGGATT